ncbi:MAG: XdhC family protein [Ignavibacteria bacterium]|nr:XdhC family protein [Ignavibacteria bacterium]
MVLNFYRNILKVLRDETNAVLMVVIRSTGSSPGRQGFLMLVTEDELTGTIGGGVMEHKLAELSRELLSKGRFEPFMRRQVHMTEAPEDRSGMICSGEQSVAFYYLDKSSIPVIEEILNDPHSYIRYDVNGISNVAESEGSDEVFITGENEWRFTRSKLPESKAYIFGGGHVSLALSEILSRLDFEIHLFDDRPGLNTMESNRYAKTKHLINFEDSADYVPEGENTYVLIMSFGHRWDEVILKALYGKKFRYIGMLGSKEKVRQMREAFLSQGFAEEYFEKLHAPVGLDIRSRTADEIAVSIAAEMIAVRNKGS